VEHTLHYAAFGETLLDNAINYQTPYQFAGYERDGESGLNYAGARYYRKDIFISTDPMWYLYPIIWKTESEKNSTQMTQI
jgi:RHS repeat-associated protein